jgi:hypothetical protein
MRNKLTALTLAITLLAGPSLIASPRGESGFDSWSPLSRIMKMFKVVKKLVLRAMDEPQQPPPEPHP